MEQVSLRSRKGRPPNPNTTPEQLEYRQQRYLKNRASLLERVKKRQKERYATDAEFRERVLARGIHWYAEHRAYAAEYNRAYRAEHAEEIRTKRVANRARENANKRAWRARNRDHSRAKQRSYYYARKARRLAAEAAA